MSVRRIERRRVPLDRWFRTTARLNSILRAMTNYNDDAIEMPKHISDVVNETTVPVWVRMEKYKAGASKKRPDGMRLGPVIRIGTMDSPEVVMHGYHHSCGLFHDYTLDSDPEDPRGRRVDLLPVRGRRRPRRRRERVRVRQVRQAQLPRRLRPPHAQLGVPDGRVGRVPRVRVARHDRSRRGAGADQGVPASRPRGRSADREACARSSAACEIFDRKVSGGGTPLQTRLWLDGDWSFSWSTLWLDKEAGEWKRYMHGGLILHGPRPLKSDRLERALLVRAVRLRHKKWRNATTEEMSRMDWSIHT